MESKTIHVIVDLSELEGACKEVEHDVANLKKSIEKVNSLFEKLTSGKAKFQVLDQSSDHTPDKC